MNGKINGLPPGQHNPRTTSRRSPARPANQWQPGAASSTGGRDTVNLTPSAHNLRQLEHTLANTPTVDQARVDALRNKIANGQYQVNSQNVANKLLRSDQFLGKLNR